MQCGVRLVRHALRTRNCSGGEIEVESESAFREQCLAEPPAVERAPLSETLFKASSSRILPAPFALRSICD